MASEKVEIVVSANDQASPALKSVAGAMSSVEPAAKRASAAADPALDGMYRRGTKAADGIKSISEQLALVQRAVLLLQGGSAIGTIIKDLKETADGYNNLAGRIRLATGEGKLFETGMEGVQRVSLDTNSSLEGTGNLFAKLTDAGKSAGQSAQTASEEALSLSETINQSIQLSGSSAQASDAALNQLVQALQSGRLNGDEFNSVMEQAPRLTRAMADGLGVTTGQLRNMANEQRLTSDVVIGAIKSQSETLKTEFSTLPPTVGRALQNLSTSWTVYVGEVDKATGASQTTASAINVLANNLSTIAGYLVDAGQAASAFIALRLAQTFLGIATATGVATAATAASTVATTANTAAQARNAAATLASDIAFKTLAADVAAQAAAIGGSTAATVKSSAAMATASVSAGRFAAILGGLKTFSLLGILTNIQDIGTWLGEATAKLAGYKDLSDQLAATERAQAAARQEGRRIAEAQAAANKAAIESQFQLTAAAKTSLAAFDDLVKGGKTAAEAVAEIGKDFDLSKAPGIVNATAILDKLVADGKISASEFAAAWSEALKGADLQAFEVQAKAALSGTAREAERVAAIMDATLREAIRRSGADMDVLAGGMSKAARSAINDTDTIIAGLGKLKSQGIDTGKALEASFTKAIKTADSQAALDALKKRIEEVRKSLGDKVADGLLRQIEDQATKAVSALGSLSGALKQLGITSDAELKRAAAETRSLYEEVSKAGGSAREQAAAFEKMAQAAIASGDAGALAFARSQAAAKGFEITTDSAGKTIVRSMKEAADATKGAGDAANAAAGGYANMAQNAEQAAAAAKKLADINARYSSPLGPGKYDSPRTGGSTAGNTREERLAGQAASDESMRFEMLAKLQAGTLTKEDLPALKALVQVLKNNQAMFDSLDPSAGSLESQADDQKWKAARTGFEQAISKLSGGSGDPGANAVGRPVNMTINVGGKKFKGQASSQKDADQLVGALEHASSRM